MDLMENLEPSHKKPSYYHVCLRWDVKYVHVPYCQTVLKEDREMLTNHLLA